MRLIPILIIGTIVLFCAGVIAPQRSRRLQGWVHGRLQKGEHKGRQRAGRLGMSPGPALDEGGFFNQS